jgi:UrcA family protein
MGNFADLARDPAREDSPAINRIGRSQMKALPSFAATKQHACVAAAIACALLSGAVHARDHDVTVTVAVSGVGLDLRDPAQARALYQRLLTAARIACGHGARVGLQPVANYPNCFEKALGNAVSSAHRPELASVYLLSHTVRDAATYGIQVPERLATD